MSAADLGSPGPATWHERVVAPQLPAARRSDGALPPNDEELAAIVHRAAQLGIPAWRIVVALGMALPRSPANE